MGTSGSATPPQASRRRPAPSSPPSVKKYARATHSLDSMMSEFEQAVAAGTSEAMAGALRSALASIAGQFVDWQKVLDEHAGGLEVHHTAFSKAEKAADRLHQRTVNLQNDPRR